MQCHGRGDERLATRQAAQGDQGALPGRDRAGRGREEIGETEPTPRLDQGIGRDSQDPLHFYEDGMNLESEVTWWHYGDPVYIERCMQASKSLEALTMVNAAGHRHFKGDIDGSAFLRVPNQPINSDSGFSAQMVHPVCEVVLYNHNPRALKFLKELGDAWSDPMASAKPGE